MQLDYGDLWHEEAVTSMQQLLYSIESGCTDTRTLEAGAVSIAQLNVSDLASGRTSAILRCNPQVTSRVDSRVATLSATLSKGLGGLQSTVLLTYLRFLGTRMTSHIFGMHGTPAKNIYLALTTSTTTASDSKTRP